MILSYVRYVIVRETSLLSVSYDVLLICICGTYFGLQAANNAAVCNVFVGELRAGLEQLEPAINACIPTSAHTPPPSSSAGVAVQSSADVCLLEGALANVGTLFEVESNAARARKMAFAETLAYHFPGDTTNPVSVLKIS